MREREAETPKNEKNKGTKKGKTYAVHREWEERREKRETKSYVERGEDPKEVKHNAE